MTKENETLCQLRETISIYLSLKAMCDLSFNTLLIDQHNIKTIVYFLTCEVEEENSEPLLKVNSLLIHNINKVLCK